MARRRWSICARSSSQIEAVLAGALDLPGYAREPARYRAEQWIPPRWDWVDPLKDIQAQVLAIEARLLSRRKAVEASRTAGVGRRPAIHEP
ncbi:MAG: hypothetical protein ACFCUS_04380 [Rubrimonas sp.]|uniref:hypothetical protein n=1 Tax=Rubrimonas sp. TaxID=2036015 RepID=UPI002FDE7B1C